MHKVVRSIYSLHPTSYRLVKPTVRFVDTEKRIEFGFCIQKGIGDHPIKDPESAIENYLAKDSRIDALIKGGPMTDGYAFGIHKTHETQEDYEADKKELEEFLKSH